MSFGDPFMSIPREADTQELESVKIVEESAPTRRAPVWPLLAILVIAFALRVGIGFERPASDWPDEVFQSREPAHRLAYGYGIVPWEWRTGMRSWVFPAVLAVVMRASDWIASGSYGYNLGILLALSALSLTVVWTAYQWGFRVGGVRAALIAAWACAVWFDLIYYDPQALPGMVAIHFLIPGMYFGIFPGSLPVRERTRMWIAGALLGLAVALRVHFAPGVLVAAVYCCWGDWKKKIGPFAVGAAVPVLAFGAVDWFTWGKPFASYINYLAMSFSNLFGRGGVGPRIAGIRPAGWYLEQLAERVGPAAVFIVLAVRRNSSLAAVAAVIIASHELIAFKHMYVIAPVLPLLVLLIGLGVAAVSTTMWRKRPVIGSLPGIALITLASVLWGMANSPWTTETDTLLAFEKLSRRTDACGVGLMTMHWSMSGGYAYLHQDVPIYPVAYEKESAPSSAYNYIVGDTEPHGFPGYSIRECSGSMCLLERAGGCDPVPEQSINEVLRRTGH